VAPQVDAWNRNVGSGAASYAGAAAAAMTPRGDNVEM